MTLQLKPSRRLRAALVFVHLLAVLCLLTGIPDWYYGLVGVPILMVSLAMCLRNAVEPQSLKLMQDGCLMCGDQLGRILSGSVAFASLIVLRVRMEEDGQTRRLVVLRDSLPPADYRRLQVWLRWVVSIKADAASV